MVTDTDIATLLGAWLWTIFLNDLKVTWHCPLRLKNDSERKSVLFIIKLENVA